MKLIGIIFFLTIAIYKYALKKQWFVSDEAYLLGLNMIENYDIWKQGTHTWSNDNICFWTANTSLDFKPYDSSNCFNYWELRYLRKCWKKARKKQVVDPKNKINKLME